MWCWDYGDNIDAVNTWSWVRYAPGATSYYGWVSDYYLTNRGALFRCRGQTSSRIAGGTEG